MRCKDRGTATGGQYSSLSKFSPPLFPSLNTKLSHSKLPKSVMILALGPVHSAATLQWAEGIAQGPACHSLLLYRMQQ